MDSDFIGLVVGDENPLWVRRYVMLTGNETVKEFENPVHLQNLEHVTNPVMLVMHKDSIEAQGYFLGNPERDTKYDIAEHVEQLRIFVEKNDISSKEKAECVKELAELLASKEKEVVDGIVLADSKVP